MSNKHFTSWRTRVLIVIAFVATGVLPAQLSAADGDSDGDGIPDAVDTVTTAGAPISVGKPAAQSSTYAEVEDFFGAALAVDGDLGGSWPDDRMAITNDAEPWWEVDLGRLHTINGVNIHTRTDCCTDRLDGAVVMLLRQPAGDADLAIVAESAVWSTTIDDADELTQLAVPTRLGRVVRIQLPADAGMNLQLAEVTVIGTQGRPNDIDADLIINSEDAIEHDGELILGGTATQSSTWTGRPNSSPEAARDDVRDGGRSGNQPIAITDDDEPWWEVDLGDWYWIDGINISNRTDGNQHLLNGARVMVAQDPFDPSMTFAEATAHADWTDTVTNAGNIVQLDTDDTIGRYIRIQLPSGAGNHLGLAEVDIIGRTGSGLEDDFDPDPSIGGFWNTHAAGQSIGEWLVVSGTADGSHNNKGPVAIPTPGHFVDLNGGSAGHIRRTVKVEPGVATSLSFDLAENVWGGVAVKQMEIIWNGEVITTLDVDLPANQSVLTTIDLPPSPTAAATLEFRSLHGSGHGPLIANPVLTTTNPGTPPDPDPEPGEVDSGPTLLDLVGPTGLEGDFDPDSSIGGFWNTHAAGQSIGEWLVVSGTADGSHNNKGPVAIPTPGHFVDLNGANAGHIRRTVYVVPNASYTLSFDLAENVWGGVAVKQMEIIWNGEVITTLDVDLPANQSVLTTIDLPPSPIAGATLEFRSLHGSGHGPLIANPALTLVAPGE